MKAPIALLAFCLLPFGLRAADTARIPLENFFKETTFSSLELSPDGQKLAALSMWKDHMNIFVIDMKTKQPTLVTGLKREEVSDVSWIGNDRLIFSTKEDGRSTGALFAIDVDGSNPAVLGNSANLAASQGYVTFRYTNYMGRYGKSTTEILVTSNQEREHDPDVWVMNVRNARKRMVARNPGGVRSWVADHTGAVRAGFGEEGRTRFLIYRDGAEGEFKRLKTWDFTEGGITPLAFDQDNRYLYVRSNVGRDREAICLFDPSTGKEVKELFSDPTYDAGGVIYSRLDGTLLGYSCMRDKPIVQWVDKRRQILQTLIDREFPDTLNSFVSRSDDDKWMLVLVHSDRDPGTYYLFNTEKPSLEKLVSVMPWIKPSQMGEMRPISYPARDGLTIHGYLTLPAGSDGKNLPLIVNPHGGPWVRDAWGFNPEVQFLASRGYAVLQMNFRGSTGYGRKLLESGYGEWGLKMQDDITDGVEWAIKEGIANPQRVGIYGASYGGFATMAGLAFTPDLYRCGVNYVGVTDIKLLLKTIPKAWESARAQLEAMTGNAKRDSAQLDRTSPMEHVDNIKVPVFFAYGVLDDRVDLKHATKMIGRLKARNIPVEMMVRSTEGHGYREFKNKVAFYSEMEKFLARYMGH